MEFLSNPEIWISLLTLSFMEIILGIDNIIFISIVTNRLPESQQARGRNIGLLLALAFRIILLLGISWIVGWTEPLISLLGFDLSGRDIILIVGGLFLIAKSTMEIHHKLEGKEGDQSAKGKATMSSVIFQIILLDIVFSFDSILTAVGLVKEVWVMITAVVIAMVVMLIFAGKISSFISKHPSLKMLALAFLLLIGFTLLIEGLHYHVSKGLIYFAMFFSLGVEILNMRLRSRSDDPVELRSHMKD